MKRLVGKGSEADRLAGEQRFNARKRQRLRAAQQTMASRDPSQVRLIGQIGFVIGKTGDVDRSQSGDVAQDMARSDLVPAIGRERDAMRDEQDFAHASPLAISGPRRFAMPSGSFCHSAILAL